MLPRRSAVPFSLHPLALKHLVALTLLPWSRTSWLNMYEAALCFSSGDERKLSRWASWSPIAFRAGGRSFLLALVHCLVGVRCCLPRSLWIKLGTDVEVTVTACCALSLSLHHFYSYLLHLPWSTKGVSAEIQGIHQVKLEPQPWISLSDSSVKEVIVYKVLFLTAPFPSFCTEVTRPTCQSETKWRISWNSFSCWLKASFLFVTKNGYGEKNPLCGLTCP